MPEWFYRNTRHPFLRLSGGRDLRFHNGLLCVTKPSDQRFVESLPDFGIFIHEVTEGDKGDREVTSEGDMHITATARLRLEKAGISVARAAEILKLTKPGSRIDVKAAEKAIQLVEGKKATGVETGPSSRGDDE